MDLGHSMSRSTNALPVMSSLRARVVSTGVKPHTFRRLVQMCRDYIASVVEEAALREHGEILDIESYIELRRNNSAVLTCFALIP